MSLGAIYPGRVSNSLMVGRLQANLQAAQVNLSKLQDQLSSGQRLSVPSDDPAAASRTLSLQRILAAKDQFKTNIQTDRSFLSTSESSLSSVGDALVQARQLLTAGIGNSTTTAGKQALATQAASLVQQVLSAANSQFRGRYLFSGSDGSQAPFTLRADGSVQYNGDAGSLPTQIDAGQYLSANVDGQTALSALSPTFGSDINPALTLNSKLSDLYGGSGVAPQQIVVTLSSSGTPQTIDLSSARTMGDIKTQIENVLGTSNVTVSINAAKNGLSITPATGTVTVADTSSGNTAARLGIVGTGAAITGGDLEPRMSLLTNLADLNGGTGIGATSGTGLRITNGGTTQVVDLTGLVTVEDLLNKLRSADLGLSVGINEQGNGLAIASRLSGSDFSIGENGGTNATLLGIRTFTTSTPLSSLNGGTGVPVDGGLKLNITRHDGTVVDVDLAGSHNVQDVLTKINGAAAGLTATLNSVGNGITLTDTSVGTTALSVESNQISDALGMAGSQSNTSLPLVGTEPNPQESPGALNLLIRLQKALQSGDDAELQRISPMFEKELARVTQVRGELGSRLKLLDDVEGRLEDEKLQVQSDISDNFDTDVATAITQLVAQQTALQATLQAAASSFQYSLVNFM